MRILRGLIFIFFAACGAPINPGLRSVANPYVGGSSHVAEFWLHTPREQRVAYGRAWGASTNVVVSLTFNHEGAPYFSTCDTGSIRVGDTTVSNEPPSRSSVSRYGGVVETVTFAIPSNALREASGDVAFVGLCGANFELQDGFISWAKFLASAAP